MSLRIELLSQREEKNYERLLLGTETALVYACTSYRHFLERLLPGSKPLYLVAKDDGRAVGGLPAFMKSNSNLGNVLNSLPFYGSNGGPIVASDAVDIQAVKKALIRGFLSVAAEESVVAATIVSNPLETDTAFGQADLGYTFRSERIGQVTALPELSMDDIRVRQMLMKSFHGKTRNAIRKAQSSNVIIYHSGSSEALGALAEMHRQNIEAVGGMVKPWEVFAGIREAFEYDRDYRVYMAERTGSIVGALLVFFFNRTAEYFTPATLDGQRVYQPMSLLVFEAMQEAVRRGCRYWNWGGTWRTQRGVYEFKRRWGAEEKPYFYHTWLFDESLLKRSKGTLLEQYPYYFVVPFEALKYEAS
jgi:hypothetical protein